MQPCTVSLDCSLPHSCTVQYTEDEQQHICSDLCTLSCNHIWSVHNRRPVPGEVSSTQAANIVLLFSTLRKKEKEVGVISPSTGSTRMPLGMLLIAHVDGVLWCGRNVFNGSVSFWKQFFSCLIHSSLGAIPRINQNNEMFKSFLVLKRIFLLCRLQAPEMLESQEEKPSMLPMLWVCPFLQWKKQYHTLWWHGRQVVLCTCQVQAWRRCHG